MAFSFLSAFIALGIVHICWSESEICEQHCKNTYPLHTYPKQQPYYACLRGCRLSRIDQVSKNTWKTKADLVKTCKRDCRWAYPIQDSFTACAIGCGKQDILPTQSAMLKAEKAKLNSAGFEVHHLVMMPILAAKRCWSGVYNGAVSIVGFRTSFFMGSNNGRMVVFQVESAPRYYEVKKETNEKLPEQKKEEPKSRLHRYYNVAHQHGMRWLNCVSTKAGLPQWLLTAFLFSSILAMIWFCCSACMDEGSQDEKHHVFDKELSVVAKDMEKMPLFTVESYEAPPLPKKVNLADIV